MTKPTPPPGPAPLTYRDSGVDADAGDALVERIGAFAKATHRPGLVAGIGGFASLFSLFDALKAAGQSMSDPLLVSGTDGVGTKLKVAFAANRHDTIGQDLVAMCVNDVLTTGAMPLFFLDYFGTGRLELGVAEAVIRGIADGCRLAKCALVGGETAELPGMYADGEYDLAGFAVGVVDRPKIIDGSAVTPGDALVGVVSRGLHSNGYSLARRALFDRAGYSVTSSVPGLDRPLGDALLEPTAIYTSVVEALLANVRPKALAHITGGGLPGNVPRVLPAATKAVIDAGAWPRPPIFAAVQAAGGITDDEMMKTFNMGLGLVAVVAKREADAAIAAITAAGERAVVVGEIREAPGAAEAFVELV
ncbi:phosphoribosylformylglycinamidine cyclo-ligase [Myxococcota bacterium]|nr:phosphoribosylformylglycinamidine cyclo-ligase [Myxococcota bacterium]